MEMVEIQETFQSAKSDNLLSEIRNSLLDFHSGVSPGSTDHHPTEEDSHLGRGGSAVRLSLTPGLSSQGIQVLLVQVRVQDASDAWKPDNMMHLTFTH